MNDEKPEYNWDTVDIPTELLWEKSFEYPLALTFDECAARLQTFRDRNSMWSTTKYYVNMTLSEQKLRAVIRRDARQGTIYAVLHAEMIGDGYLQLHFKVGASHDLVYFVPLLITVIILAILSVNLNAILVALGISVVSVISARYKVLQARESLIVAIEHVF